jgi:hypothetical protein
MHEPDSGKYITVCSLFKANYYISTEKKVTSYFLPVNLHIFLQSKDTSNNICCIYSGITNNIISKTPSCVLHVEKKGRMTFENSNNNNIGINDNDNQRMVISNLISSTSAGANTSSSSRRKKGKPQKCVDSTLANGSTDNFPSTTSLLGESNPRLGSSNDDSGIEASFNSLLANLLPSTSLADSEAVGNPDVDDQQLSPQQQLVKTLQACLNAAILPNTSTTDSARDSVSPSMIPPPTANSLIATSFLPSLTAAKPAQKPSSKKRKLKQVQKVEDVPPVTLPDGFEQLLKKVKHEPKPISDLDGTSTLSTSSVTSRPTSANEIDQQQQTPPKKKRETGRCETKATIQAPDGTIVEGNYNPQELNDFVKEFKVLRNKYGFTQGDVGAALGKRYGADFSQTTISRFEALNLSYKNMCKLRPLLEEWLGDIEKAVALGVPISDLLTMSNFDSDSTMMVGGSSSSSNTNNNYGLMRDNQSGSNSPESRPHPIHVSKLNAKIIPPLKKRRKRTNLEEQQRNALDTYFLLNPRPDPREISEISNALNLDSDVVRVWFCNRRQKTRKTEE